MIFPISQISENSPAGKIYLPQKTPCPPGIVCPKNTHNLKPQTSFYVILESPKTPTNPGPPPSLETHPRQSGKSRQFARQSNRN